ncbi:MAG: hypothetical protein JKX75_08355 [Gammaproteobacteria bacterium]|nr:hypothetical protein [Gammaproteobacteria bacterium]
MGNLKETVHKNCHAYSGGIKLLAEKLSLHTNTLHNKCNARMTSSHLNLQEALVVMHLSQDISILRLLCRKTHHACVSSETFQNISDMVLFEAWTSCDMEHGITAKIIRDALQDKCIDNTEFQKIRSEMFIDFSRQLELLDRLRQFSGHTETTPVNNDLTLINAIYETIHNTSKKPTEIASSINLRESELRKKSDPNNPDDILTVEETLSLMSETKNYSILYALGKELRHTCVAIPLYDGINDMELLDAWSSWSDERGDTVSVIHTSLMDGTIEYDELAHIEEEMFQDFHTELALLARLWLMIQ